MQNLKDKNKLSLAGLMGAPLLITLVLQIGISDAKGTVEYFTAAVGLAALAGGVLVMFSDVLPQALKHKLVFLRLWNELPGHRCDKLCFAEPRLSTDELKTSWHHVFGAEIPRKERNGLWYKHIYKPVMDEPQVQSAHQKFLLYRDATAGSLIILLLLVAWAWSGLSLPYLGGLHPWAIGIQAFFIVCMLFGAQSYGNRMVVNATVMRTTS
ncbi:hypothetical protein NJR02_00265 [Aeromonas caviae]|uniref:hypothetical protein n=1 Tax=Aeromonas caviae TaxID=648 RepID=UPI0020B64315|nr:hypothetical protein [Aeromonas caviae]UTI02693.1 hypothetical protein NJR02_00265 [Aeromonas caviae]